MSLAFETADLFQYTDKLAILMASFAAGVFGYAVLRYGKSGKQS